MCLIVTFSIEIRFCFFVSLAPGAIWVFVIILSWYTKWFMAFSFSRRSIDLAFIVGCVVFVPISDYILPMENNEKVWAMVGLFLSLPFFYVTFLRERSK